MYEKITETKTLKKRKENGLFLKFKKNIYIYKSLKIKCKKKFNLYILFILYLLNNKILQTHR